MRWKRRVRDDDDKTLPLSELERKFEWPERAGAAEWTLVGLTVITIGVTLLVVVLAFVGGGR